MGIEKAVLLCRVTGFEASTRVAFRVGASLPTMALSRGPMMPMKSTSSIESQ